MHKFYHQFFFYETVYFKKPKHFNKKCLKQNIKNVFAPKSKIKNIHISCYTHTIFMNSQCLAWAYCDKICLKRDESFSAKKNWLLYCRREDNLLCVWQSKHVYVWCSKWVVHPRERKKKRRNMAALTSQFKIKSFLNRGEFVRVAYANFFEANVPAKHKNTIERCMVWSSEDIILIGRRMQSSEDIILVSRIM